MNRNAREGGPELRSPLWMKILAWGFQPAGTLAFATMTGGALLVVLAVLSWTDDSGFGGALLRAGLLFVAWKMMRWSYRLGVGVWRNVSRE